MACQKCVAANAMGGILLQYKTTFTTVSSRTFVEVERGISSFDELYLSTIVQIFSLPKSYGNDENLLLKLKLISRNKARPSAIIIDERIPAALTATIIQNSI